VEPLQQQGKIIPSSVRLTQTAQEVIKPAKDDTPSPNDVRHQLIVDVL
jgi:hypothetical protein